ncbi:hypothetical protein Tco_1472719, partial [Tanacetum coccineum]
MAYRSSDTLTNFKFSYYISVLYRIPSSEAYTADCLSSVSGSALQGVRRAHSTFRRPGTKSVWKKRLQETMMELTLEEFLCMFMAEIAKRHDEHSNLIKKIQASTDFALRNQEASIKALRIQERKDHDGEKDLEAHYTNENPIGKALPRKKKDPGSFTLPCFINNMRFNKALADLGASLNDLKEIAENVLVGIGDQVDDLMPTIKEGKVIEEVKARNNARMVSKFFGFPSDYDQSEKIRIDCAHNLKFSCMIGFEFIHANFLPNLPINVLSKKVYNSIIKDKIKFRERNELGNWANVPIFIGNFNVLISFAVVENIDPYVDEGMGEVVVGKPF